MKHLNKKKRFMKTQCMIIIYNFCKKKKNSYKRQGQLKIYYWFEEKYLESMK